MNILLIEPDRILGAAAGAAFKSAGHTVKWCKTAQSALDALDDGLPDIIILELQLGIHNGIEFLYELRSYPEWQHLPVIVHTLNANVMDNRFNEPLKQLGVWKLLYKPHTFTNKLVQAVGGQSLI